MLSNLVLGSRRSLEIQNWFFNAIACKLKLLLQAFLGSASTTKFTSLKNGAEFSKESEKQRDSVRNEERDIPHQTQYNHVFHQLDIFGICNWHYRPYAMPLLTVEDCLPVD